MPGTTVWTGGANDGVWATGGNWTAGTGSAPPASGDTAIIGVGNQNIHGATVATTTLTIKVLPSYGGIIGDDGALIFSSGITLLEYAGTGASANIACTGGTTAAATFTHSGSQVSITGGTWTLITNGSGPLSIAAAAVVTTLKNASGQVTVGANATAITLLTNSGTVTSYRTHTTTNVDRGTVILMDNGNTTYTSGGTVTVGNGGVYNKRSGGTDTLVEVKPGGTFTIAGTSGGSAGAITLTNATYWGGSTVMDAVPGITVTYTNPKAYIGLSAAR